MSSETSASYAVYNLWKHYSVPPDTFRCCPVCGEVLSKSSISQSKAVASDLARAAIGIHHFSHLYECSSRHWWAVWESWEDVEYVGAHFQYLVVGLSDTHQVILDMPWHQALENEHVYDHHMPLPESLEQVLIGGKKRITDLPKPGDKVLLVGDVYVLREGKRVPLFIGGSEGIVVTDEELYTGIKEQTKEWCKSNNLLIALEDFTRIQFGELKTAIEISNCCPIRLEKLIVSHGKWRRNSCEEGGVYLIDAADIKKVG